MSRAIRGEYQVIIIFLIIVLVLDRKYNVSGFYT